MELGIYTEPEIERNSKLTQSHIIQQVEKFTWTTKRYGLTINAVYQACKKQVGLGKNTDFPILYLNDPDTDT